jgi:hypothetical protein
MSERIAPGTQHEIAESLVGKTIIGAQWLYDELADHEPLYLRLDDGRLLRFRSWGNEAWGVIVEVINEQIDGHDHG